MNRRSFVNAYLSGLSSHPATIGFRARRWFLWSFAPIGAGLALFLLAWRFGAVSLSSLAYDWDRWLPLSLALLVLGFTFGATAMLTLRLSTLRGTEEPRGGSRRLLIWTWILIAVAVSLLAFLLVRATFLQGTIDERWVSRLRWGGHLLGTAPVLLAFLYVSLQAPVVDEWGEEQGRLPRGAALRRVILLAGVLIGAILPILWLDQIATALTNSMSLVAMQQLYPAFSPFQPTLDSLQRLLPFLNLTDLQSAIPMVAAAATLIPLLGMGFAIATAVFGISLQRKANREPISPAEVVELQGYNLRPPGESWLVDGVGVNRSPPVRWRSVEREQQPQQSVEPAVSVESPGIVGPQWLQELVAGNPRLRWGGLARVDLGETSKPSLRDDVAHVFLCAAMSGDGTARPTQDQVAALELFDRRFEELMRAEDREGLHIYPSTDLLVSGPPGSGRSTLLFALAMHAVVLRGQAVLVLCQTPEKARKYADRLRDVATRSGMGWYVSVAELSRDDVLSWADQREDAAYKDLPYLSPRGSVPDILVGTPHDFERLMYGADIHHAPVRRSLLRLQVVLIEDLTTFDPREQRHLPFLIDKHRLLLGAEHMPVQFVAVMPPLSDTAAASLGERLFSEREKVHQVTLRPWEGDTPWFVDVEGGEDSGQTLEDLARWCVENEVDVVVHRPHIGSYEREQLAARLQGRGRAARVIADFDELPLTVPIGPSAGMYRAVGASDQSLALRSRLGGEDIVLIRVTAAGQPHPQHSGDITLPVLPAAHSPALVVGHIQSALRHLAPFTPIPRDLWAKMGLGADGALLAHPRLEPTFKPRANVELVLDPPEDAVSGKSAARDQVWSWVALHVPTGDETRVVLPPDAQPMEMYRPLDRGLDWRLNHENDRVFLGASTDASLEDSVAAWSTQKGESLDRLDLAYADTLLLRRRADVAGDDGRYFPSVIKPASRGLAIIGIPYRDRGLGEHYLPIWDARIVVPLGVQAAVAHSPTDTVRFVSLGTESPLEPKAQARFALSADTDEVGNVRPFQPAVDVMYETRVCALLLKPHASVVRNVGAALVGAWATFDTTNAASDQRGRPWPLLGLVLTAAFRQVMPSLFEYCRLAAFEPDERVSAGGAVVYLIEPIATRGTIQHSVSTLLGDPALTLQLLAVALEEAQLLSEQEDCPALRFLRVKAGYLVGPADFVHDQYLHQREAAVRLLTDICEDLRGKIALAARRRA